MKRHLVGAAIVAAGSLAILVNPVISYADKLSDAQNKANQLAQQQKQTQASISSLKQQESSLSAQVSALQKQVYQLQQSVSDTQADITRRNQQITLLKQKIADTQKQIDAQYAVLADRIRVMYEDSNTSYLEVLFSSTSFSDLLDRLNFLTLIANQDKQILDGIKQDKANLDQQNVTLNNQLAAVQVQYKSLVQKQQQQEAAQQNEEHLLSQVHDQRLKEQADLNNENAAMQSLKSLIEQLEAQSGGYSGPATGWTWPVPGYHSISSGYGWRTWPDGSREFHNGIDIPAPVGTPMVAATSGKVLMAGPASGFGDWVVIESAGGLLEIYGHMYSWELKVSPGEIVHTGQVIAAVGSNGESTGPHLHFTIATGFDAAGFAVSVSPLKYLG